MVVIDDVRLTLPNTSKKIGDIQGLILDKIKQYGFKERVIYPSYVLSSFYEAHYDDVKLQYLIDFKNDKDEVYVFNPEYRTLARETSFHQFASIKNYDFHYIQKIMSYNSPERDDIIEDIVIGICTVNPDDEDDTWDQLCTCAKEVLKIIDFNNTTFNDSFNDSIKLFLRGKRVAFGKKESEKGFMSIHFSVNDILKSIKE